VGDASAFRVWGSLALVCDPPAGKLSPRTLRCVFLGFPNDAPPWCFYHRSSRRVLSSKDVTFDESVCFYRLHPHRSSPVPLPPLFLVDPSPLLAPLEVSSDTVALAAQRAWRPLLGFRLDRLHCLCSPSLWTLCPTGIGGAGGTGAGSASARVTGVGGAGGTGAGGARAGSTGARRQDTLLLERLHCPTATATAATGAPAYCATMASLRVLAFDHEGRPVQFDTWLDDLQQYLLSDIKDGVSLFDHVSSAATAPWRVEFGDDVELPRWADLLRSRIAIFDLDFDAILSALYALCVSAEGDCYQCVPPDPGIAAAALGASESGTLPGTAPTQALHTFTLDSGASACFFRDSTTLTPLPTPVPVQLADPSGGPVVARSSSVLPCPAVPSGSLSGLHLPSFFANLVSTAALQDAMVTTTAPGGQRVTICTCTRTGRHLATFTRRPRSSLYTLATEPPQVAASAQVSASSQVAASCSCRLLSHQTLLWHRRLGHPSLPRLRGMHSRLLVSSLPRSLPLLPPSPATPCLPCVEGRQRAAPHSSSFPLTTAPLQALHMDVWGPARVSGQSRERYFLLVIDDYTQYTTVFPLHSKGEVVDVLIPWIRTVRLQLCERFGQDLPVLRLHPDRGGEFSSNLLRDFCRGEGILQSFTLPHSSQQNGIAERRIGLLNLWPRVFLLETSPTLRWTGEVGDASVFRVWGSRAFVRDTSADKLSPHVIPCDVTFDESVPFYRLFPYCSAPPPPPPLFLAPGPPPIDPLPPQGLAPSGVSQVYPLSGPAPVQVAVGSGAARGAAAGGAASGGEELGGAESEGAETGGAEPGGVETGGAEPGGAELESFGPGGAASEGAESGGGEPQGAALSGGSIGASPRLSPQQLEVLELKELEVLELLELVFLEVLQPLVLEVLVPGVLELPGLVVLRVLELETLRSLELLLLAALALVRLEQEELELEALAHEALELEALVLEVLELADLELLTLVAMCGRDRTSFPCFSRLLPASPLPAASPYIEQSGGLTEHREPVSRPVSPVRTARRVPHSRPPPVLDTHAMTLRPSSVLLRVPLPAPPESSLPEVPDLESDRARAARPTVSRLLTTAIIDPTFEGPYSSQWQAAMDAEMASWKSTGTYVDEVPPPGANIADGMWIFRVKRPPDSPLAFKALYVAQGFGQRQGVDYFHTFSPTPKMTTLWVLLHVAAQRDYELLSLDFSTAFLQGSLHEEIWLRRPPGFTGSFPAGTLWSLRQPVYGLRQVPHEWHDTLRTTLAALGFAPATADTSLFLLTDTSLPTFYILVYVDDLVFATADPEALTLVKSELPKRHTCTDLGELHSYLGLQITRDRARRTITLTQSHMVHQVLQCFGFHFSSPQPTPLSTTHSLSAPPLDESVEPSGPYPELVGCLMYLMTCTRPDLAYPLSLLDRYVAPGRHRKVHWDAAKRVLRYLCSTSGMGLVLGGRGPVVLTGHADASWVDDSATQRSSHGYTFSLGSGSVSWRSTRSSSVLSSSCEAEIYAEAMGAQELHWLTYLLTDLGEQPRSHPVLVSTCAGAGGTRVGGARGTGAGGAGAGNTGAVGAVRAETYALVSSYVTLRLFLSIVAVLDLNLMQLDMKNAFLLSKLEWVLYMYQPDYYNDRTGRVCKLLKSLYGLGQSPLLWYKVLNDVLTGAGWKKSQVDEALYFKVGGDRVVCWVLVYVDNLLVTSSSTTMLKELKELLEAAFDLRKISPVEKYLGLDIVRDRTARKQWLYQQGYADKLRRWFIDEEKIEPTTKILVSFGGGPETLELANYVDADDAGDKQNQMSTGGYVFVYRGAAVSWSSQRISALHCQRPSQITWRPPRPARRDTAFAYAEFLPLNVGTPTVFRVDNKSAITVAEDLGLQGNLKHMGRRYAWLQHMVKHGKFTLKYIPTTKQPADFLTKALHFPAFNRCSVAIGQVRLADVDDDDVQQQVPCPLAWLVR
ncbi:unnamed protein product, partial [Closterium sp. NIES-54]